MFYIFFEIFFQNTFKDGNYHGIGTLNFSNGDRYFGEWRNNLQYGVGDFIGIDGRSYKGNWVLGKRHGMGKYCSVNVCFIFFKI